MQPLRPGERRQWLTVPALLLVLAASASLNFINLDFPLGYHADEPLKVSFVAEGRQNFYHPILLLQLARLGCALVGAAEPMAIVQVGRTVSAVSGVALVLGVFVLARRQLSPLAATAAAAVVGLSPIVAIHAHYFKEDILFTLAVALALLAGVRAEERPTRGRMIGLGVGLGLAASSKYVGVLLAPLLVVRAALAVRRVRGGPFTAAGLVLGVGFAVFSLINYPMFLAPGTFVAGLGFELNHMTTGHGPLVISPLEWGFAFHLLYSLLPGLTTPVAVLVLTALAAHLLCWLRISSEDRLLALTALLFYFSAELSPTKPHPDFMRYMLPLVPPLALLAVLGVARAAAARRALGWLAGLALAGAVGWSAAASVRLVAGMAHDTRTEAARWLAERGEPWTGEWFTSSRRPVDSVAVVDIEAERRAGTRYLVASSFMYERAFLACKPDSCDEEMRPYAEGYRRLFRYPFFEIRPAYCSFAFSNPVVRIVDIRLEPAP